MFLAYNRNVCCHVFFSAAKSGIFHWPEGSDDMVELLQFDDPISSPLSGSVPAIWHLLLHCKIHCVDAALQVNLQSRTSIFLVEKTKQNHNFPGSLSFWSFLLPNVVLETQ